MYKEYYVVLLYSVVLMFHQEGAIKCTIIPKIYMLYVVVLSCASLQPQSSSFSTARLSTPPPLPMLTVSDSRS